MSKIYYVDLACIVIEADSEDDACKKVREKLKDHTQVVVVVNAEEA